MLVGCRVVAIDQRGHGLTDHLRRPYHIWDGVPDVIEVLEALGWDRAILLGHSMGAAVATLVAGAYPDRIQQLWLLEGLGPWTYSDGEAPDQLRQSTERLRQMDDRQLPYMSRSTKLLTRVFEVECYHLPGPLRIQSSVVGLSGTRKGWTWASDKFLTSPPLFRMDEQQIRVFIERLDMPVSLALVTWDFLGIPYFYRRESNFVET